jgi:hypothetical protein
LERVAQVIARSTEDEWEQTAMVLVSFLETTFERRGVAFGADLGGRRRGISLNVGASSALATLREGERVCRRRLRRPVPMPMLLMYYRTGRCEGNPSPEDEIRSQVALWLEARLAGE